MITLHHVHHSTMLGCSSFGSPDVIESRLELLVGVIWDYAGRVKSCEFLVEAMG